MMLLDRHYGSLADAEKAAREERRTKADDSVIVKVEKSPYGGYRLRSFPMDVWVEASADGLPMDSIFPILGRKPYG
jgi:hypothetical protein